VPISVTVENFDPRETSDLATAMFGGVMRISAAGCRNCRRGFKTKDQLIQVIKWPCYCNPFRRETPEVEYDLEDRNIFRMDPARDSILGECKRNIGGTGEADQGRVIADRNRFGGSELGRRGRLFASVGWLVKHKDHDAN